MIQVIMKFEVHSGPAQLDTFICTAAAAAASCT